MRSCRHAVSQCWRENIIKTQKSRDEYVDGDVKLNEMLIQSPLKQLETEGKKGGSTAYFLCTMVLWGGCDKVMFLNGAGMGKTQDGNSVGFRPKRFFQ